MNGMVYVSWSEGDYFSATSDQSLQALAGLCGSSSNPAWLL